MQAVCKSCAKVYAQGAFNHAQANSCASAIFRRQGGVFLACGYGSDYDMNLYKFVEQPALAEVDPICDRCIEQLVENNKIVLIRQNVLTDLQGNPELRRHPTPCYVTGFAFTPDGLDVLLIKKSKPAWQEGKLNGVGGKVEQNESGVEAMVREFREETGIETQVTDWKLCVVANVGEENGEVEREVSFYRAVLPDLKARVQAAAEAQGNAVVHTYASPWDRTEEIRLTWTSVTTLGPDQIVTNLLWLLPMLRPRAAETWPEFPFELRLNAPSMPKDKD